MKLHNNYKVIYNSTRDGQLHLYGTKSIPMAGDLRLTYVNEEGDELTDQDIAEIKLCYSKNDHIYYTKNRLPAEGDHRLAAFCDEELVFGDADIEPGERYEVTVPAVAHCVVTGAGKYAVGKQVLITVEPEADYIFGEGNAPKCGNAVMTKNGNKFEYSFEMPAEPVEAAISGVVVKQKPVIYDAYWCSCDEPATAISTKFTAVKTISNKEITVTYPNKVDDVFYPAIAIKEGCGTVKAVYQPNSPMPDQNIFVNDEGECAFTITNVSYNGTKYTMYCLGEPMMSDAPEAFRFCLE